MIRETQDPTRPEEELEQPGGVRPTSPTDKPPAGDARGDEEKRKQNREHLGVDEEHKTPDMKKKHRGTFP